MVLTDTAVTPYGAKWIINPPKHALKFVKNKFKNSVKYVKDNCYFTSCYRLFLHLSGIQMRSDPATFMINLFNTSVKENGLKKLKRLIQIGQEDLMIHSDL